MFTVYSAYTRANQKVVVINPGHSMGYDSGAVSDYISEAQLNQEVAGKVVRQLSALGYKVYITHTTDTELEGQKLLSNYDASYLRNVGPAMKTVHPDLTMSIHHNSGGRSSSGYELYWSSYRDYDQEGVYTVPDLWSTGELAYRDSSPQPEAVQSEAFAQVMKRHLDGEPNLAFRKIVERNDYVPAHSTCPSILYEGGYLSNPEEAQYLASEAYKVEAANRITAAIDEFLGGSGNTGAPQTDAAVNDSEPPTITSVYSSATETSSLDFTMEAKATDNTGISSVRFATWTDANGQDDIVWKEGNNNGDGSYSVNISASEHNMESGAYTTHVYAYDGAGNYVGVEAPKVTITNAAVKPGVSVDKLNSTMAVAYANNLGSTNGYKFAVWSENNGQDDLIWSEGEQQVGGVYKSVINRSDHKNDGGKYFVHVYTGSDQFVGANEIEFGVPTGNLELKDNNGNVDINLSNISAPDGIKSVNVAVWTEDGGQDDLKWYAADKVSDNNYKKLVPTAEHGGNGFYNVHAYLVDNYDQNVIVAGSAIQISSSSTVTSDMNLGPISSTIGGQTGNTFQVTTNNVPGNKSILVPTWSEENGQDDLVWYEASNAGNNTYVATINLANHKGSGTYNVHVYTRDMNNGSIEMAGQYTTQINNSQAAAPTSVSPDTPIMGNVGTTAGQLAEMYTKHAGHEFPNYYVARGVSLNQFCQFYVDEASAENVRADIAFAQAMEETAFLGFGGDVSISQFNFAGLGATGGGVAGENFAAQHGDNANGIQMGIRAQIQHLKAYASTDPLVNPTVDNRFSYVSRGKATTIAGLAGTWAADKAYAGKLVTICNYIYS